MATTLEMLLAAMNQGAPGLPNPAPSMPIPLTTAGQAPTPQYGGPSMVTEPPQAPLDNRIIQQYGALAGQAPTPPTPLSRGQRIANALMGFSAGVEGRGGQFLQQLQEPQRQYQQQVERYNNTRSDLAQRGLDVALRQQERQTARAQELSDREFQQEFQRETRRLNLYDDESKMRLQQAFQLERDARQARLQEAHQLAIEQRQREDDARGIAARLGTGPGAAPPHIARELAKYYANITQELSPAAARWQNAQARRAEILARPAVGGGGSAASRRELQDLQRRTSQAAQGIAGMEKLARQAMESDESKRAPILNQMRSMAGTLQAQFPELLEVGEHNGWPFARLRLRGSVGRGQQQPQAAPDPAGLLR